MSLYYLLFEKDEEITLDYYGLTPFLKGNTIIAYHGTTSTFDKFDINKSRDELNRQYYGNGIFFTPKKEIAEKYAYANRNMGFPKNIINDLKLKNKEAGIFLEELYNLGADAWDLEKYQKPNKHGGIGSYVDGFNGVDANTLQDIAAWIIGSKIKPLSTGNDFELFNNSTGMPSYIYDLLDEIGLNSFLYAPKVYTVEIKTTNPLITSDAKKALTAQKNGYDAVVFMGEKLVGDVPEIAIFDTDHIQIKNVERV